MVRCGVVSGLFHLETASRHQRFSRSTIPQHPRDKISAGAVNHKINMGNKKYYKNISNDISILQHSGYYAYHIF
jgi:hypothetical protein